jgi:hypothetical protein
MAYIYYLTHIHLGYDALSQLPSECGRIGIKRPLIITDKGVVTAGKQVRQGRSGRARGPLPSHESARSHGRRLPPHADRVALMKTADSTIDNTRPRQPDATPR